MTSDGNMMTTGEVAEALGVSTRTLFEWRRGHIGPPYLQVNQIIRYDRAEFEAWREKLLRGVKA